MRTGRGGAMTMHELLSLSTAMATARRLKVYIEEDKPSEGTNLRALSDALENLKQVENEINEKIISEDEMADGASPALFAIRRKLKTQAGKIRDTLNSIITSGRFQKFLQEPIITMRGDRYVVPVKTENKNEIKGIVHDASSSGSTVFIEPASVVEMTNEITELKGKEKEEIERILYELSAFLFSVLLFTYFRFIQYPFVFSCPQPFFVAFIVYVPGFR